MSKFMSAIRKQVGDLLSPAQTLWVRRFRRGEHAWQSKLSSMRGNFRGVQRGSSERQASEDAPNSVARGFDAHAEALRNLSEVRKCLAAHKIDFIEFPRLRSQAPHIVIHQSKTQKAYEALLSLPLENGWHVTLQTEKGTTVSPSALRKSPDRVFAMQASRRIIAPNGREMSGDVEKVTIEPWEELGANVGRADGSTYLPGTLHRRIEKRGLPVDYIAPSLWRDIVDNHDSRLSWPAPHLYEVTYPIDIVYTWVDGSDAAWRAKKSRALGIVDTDEINDTAIDESRFINREELRYSLRSVEAYANWVNHIYIVTDQQVPPWLNTDHPKITIVDHTEIFSDTSVLPVFNSHAIESQLHHIGGLNEHYLYMNDDLLFMSPVSPELFFTSNGLSKFFPSTAPLDMHPPSAHDLPVLSAAKRGRQFMIDVHGRTVSNKFKHTPHPQLKSVLEHMERDHPELFAAVAASKFRHPDDYSIASALYHFHAYAQAKAIAGDIRYGYVDIGSSRATIKLDWMLHNKELDVLCVNDTIDDHEEPMVSEELSRFLSSRFPIPSSFERHEE